MSKPAGRANILAVVVALVAAAWCTPRLNADTPVYTHPPDPAGGQYKSAWWAPDGFDDDEYVWDAFTLGANTAITEVRWRGAYGNFPSGTGQSPVYDFTVSIYASIAGGFQPDVTHPPLVKYHTNNSAGETPAGIFGGFAMFDYHFALPSAFQAVAGTKYWVQIEAYQGLTPSGWRPDWSIARGTGNDGSHFHRIGGTGGYFSYRSGDCAFTLMMSGAPTFTISASVTPAGAGSVSGTGAYPVNSTATLHATANTGYGFQRWTEGGAQVSTNPNYAFTVTQNRALVANFVPAYTITTGSLPTYGGTATGGGTFNQGASVTVTAAANPGFEFAGWTWYGTPVSASPVYTFPAEADLALTAEFVHAPLSTTFTFDDGPVHTSLPVSLSSGGVDATLSGNYSIQPANSLGFTPAGFEGLCVYPNSVFAADLTVDFSLPLTFFSIMYSPQELGCDDSATMRVTAFLNGVEVGTDTATAPVPGTWPTGTLSITVPGGFDRAVVHYDHRPPTCQDYGVIFLADNMTVTTVCVQPSVWDQPLDAATCPDGGATFWVGAGQPAPAYQWQREVSPGSGVFVDLADGPTGSWDGGAPGVGGQVYGAATDTLSIFADAGAGLRLSTVHAGRVRCVLSTSCGTAMSDAAMLTVCPSDFDCNGFVNGDDFDAFMFEFEWGTDLADFDRNGFVNGDDFDSFAISFNDGC